MIRLNLREQLLYMFFLLFLQLPLLHRVYLFDNGVIFFYVGFILFLPKPLGKIYYMLIAFVAGTLVDMFSNTYGLHSFASVLIAFIMRWWLLTINTDYANITNINYSSLKLNGFLAYVSPLLLIHHSIVLIVENGGFVQFWMLLVRIILSTLSSFIMISIVGYAFSPKDIRI